MAVKVSYSSGGKQPAFGAAQRKLAGTANLRAQPDVIARALAARSSANPVSDVLNSAKVASANMPAFGSSTPTAKPAFTPPPAGTAAGAPAGQQTPGATVGAGSTFGDYNDPVIAQIQAAGQRSTLDAQSVHDAAYKQGLIRFGDQGLASTLTGGDTATAQAAGQNPTSTLAQLLYQHQQNQGAIDQATNAQNLFYSSARANQLGQEQQQNLFGQSSAQDQLQQQLAAYDDALRQQKQAAQDQLTGALPGAFDRWSQLTPPPVPVDGTLPPGDGTTPPAQSPNPFAGTAQAGILAALLAGRLRASPTPGTNYAY